MERKSGSGQVWPAAFGPDQPNQGGAERYQGNNEKDGATVVVNRGIEHVRAKVHAKLSQSENAKSIP